MRKIIRLCGMLMLLVFGIAACGTGSNGTDTIASVPPNLGGAVPSFITQVTHGVSGFVAVGNDGFIVTSPDGRVGSWTSIQVPLSTHFTAVTFGGGVVMAGGLGGQIFTAPESDESNSLAWLSSTPSSLGNIRGLAYGLDASTQTNIFVAVDDIGNIATVSSLQQNPSIYAVNIVYSATPAESPLFAVTNVAGGSFVAVGANGTILRSYDLNSSGTVHVTQESSGVDTPLYAVTAAANKIVAVGESGVVDVFESNVWVPQSIGDATEDFTGITYRDGKFIVTSTESGHVWILNDAARGNWYQSPTDFNQSLYGITFANGHLLAVGESSIMRSVPDILQFTNIGETIANLTGVINVSDNSNKFIFTAADGIYDYIVGTTPTKNISAGSASFTGIATDGNGTYKAVGKSGVILNSTDGGQTWSSESSTVQNDLNSIAYANGIFAAVGNGVILQESNGGWQQVQGSQIAGDGCSDHVNNLVSIASDGSSFTSVEMLVESPTLSQNINFYKNGPEAWACSFGSMAVDVPANSIFYGGNQFITVSDNGLIYRSVTGEFTVPGTAWILVANSGTNNNWRAGTYANGEYIAVGDNGKVLVSADGNAWSVESTVINGATQNLTGVACNNLGFCVATAESGIATAQFESGISFSQVF